LESLNPNSPVNYSKLDKRLSNKLKKILGHRKRGSNKDNSDSGIGKFTSGGISKLTTPPTSSGPSKEYLKAKKKAEDQAKKKAEELESEFKGAFKQKSKNIHTGRKNVVRKHFLISKRIIQFNK
jgi:hypothetical protein